VLRVLILTAIIIFALALPAGAWPEENRLEEVLPEDLSLGEDGPIDEPLLEDPMQDVPPVEDHDYEEHYYRARVLRVDQTRIDEQEYFTTIEQEVLVELTSGPYEGREIEILNTFFEGDPVYDFVLEAGQEVIVVALGEEGDFEQVYVQDLARDRGVYYLLGAFVLVLLLVGRMKGLKTLITLVVTIFLIFQFLLPLLLMGYSPIPLAVIMASMAITFTLFVIGGLNLKSLVAILGTISGVIVAGLMAFWAGSIARLTGFGSHEAQMLYFLDQSIDFRGLLFAGIIIGSLGAITDIGMSVASAAAEIRQASPDISSKDLFRGSLNVGRDVMGTMANTLIMAYVGAATPMLLLVMGYEMDWLKVINMDIIATEFVRGAAGSIGLVAAVPVTALLAARLLAGHR